MSPSARPSAPGLGRDGGEAPCCASPLASMLPDGWFARAVAPGEVGAAVIDSVEGGGTAPAAAGALAAGPPRASPVALVPMPAPATAAPPPGTPDAAARGRPPKVPTRGAVPSARVAEEIELPAAMPTAVEPSAARIDGRGFGD